jgi:hypothetical protein
MRRAILSLLALACLGGSAFGCFQIDYPRAELPTQSLNLRVTYNDKVRGGRTFQLHKAITPHPARGQARYAKKVLKSATTDSQGLASFGEVAPGIYWIKGGANDIAVTIIPPTNTPAKRIWVNEYADGCINAAVESAN